MMIALGKGHADEYKDNLHKVFTANPSLCAAASSVWMPALQFLSELKTLNLMRFNYNGYSSLLVFFVGQQVPKR